MRGIIIGLAALVLAACGTQSPAYPATIEALQATGVAQATSASQEQAASQARARQFEALRATATAQMLMPPRESPATAAPTPTGAPPVTAALSMTAALGSTGILSGTAALDGCGPLPPDTVDYSEAAALIGKVGSVQGRVVKVGRSKKAVFLNFHDPYQGHFSGVIFISAWKQFPGRFEDLYQGRCVRIAGAVKAYKGAPEIVIESPAQIVVLP